MTLILVKTKNLNEAIQPNAPAVGNFDPRVLPSCDTLWYYSCEKWSNAMQNISCCFPMRCKNMESSNLQATPGQQPIAKMAAVRPPRRRSSATSDGLEGVIFVNEAALVSSDPALVRGVLFEMSTLLGFR